MICRLPASGELPGWIPSGAFTSITRTAQELSIVCAETAVPPDVRVERGFRTLMIEGPFPFDAVGVLASITAPLADAGIPIFAISTFDTDYVLVNEHELAAARCALEAHGHSVMGM